MKKILTLLAAGMMFLAGTVSSRAVVFDIDLSPAGGTALNLGAPPTWYFGDHAVGLAAPNEGPFAPPSPATGNELGLGIKFDSVTKMLTFHVGYGSVFGFTDMSSPFGAAHLHAPGAVLFPAPNAAGPVIIGLGGFFAPAGPGSGSFFGSVPLTPIQEGLLFDNRIYWNIHSSAFPGGEIRGQLVVVSVPEPSTAALILLGALAIPLRRRC